MANTQETGQSYTVKPDDTLVKIADEGVTPPNGDFVKRILELTNIERSKAGLPPLTFNPLLATAAQNHSEDMALHDYFSHTGLDGSSPFDRINSTGYQFSAAAENIAAGQSTPESAMASWMNEVPPNDGHRRNILNPDYRDIGVGYYLLANDTGKVNYHHYWTQDFATPL